MRGIQWGVVLFALLFAGAAAAQTQYGPRPPPGNYQTVSCGSGQYKLARCTAPRNWRGAQLVRQTSKSACIQGRTWGFAGGSVWVDKGCGGLFAAGNFNGGQPGGGWQPGPGWNQNFTMSCGSPQYQRYFCEVDVGARGTVRLQRQISSTRCVEGRNWGFNRAGIWVDKGCGAQFLVMRRW